MVDEKIVTERKADGMFAQMVSTSGSATRTAIDAIMPRSTSTTTVPSTSLAQVVRQRTDGSWANPVRDSNVNGRIYVASVDATKTPRQADGLAVGDVLIGKTGVFVASNVPSSGASIMWDVVSTAGSGSGSGTTTTPGTGTSGGTTTNPTNPTDPTSPTPGGGGTTTPTPVPGDTTTPAPTARPHALLGTTGTWSTTGGATLVQALSDQHLSTASATPDSSSSGVSVTLDMSNFAHTSGNDLTVTLWGAVSAQTGPVTVWVGKGATQYAPAKTLNVTGAAQDLSFTWPSSETLSLPVSQWTDIELTITRATGGFTTLADVTLQSVTPKIITIPGGDPLTPASVLWDPTSVWYSNLSTAPVANASAAIASYVKSQATSGAMRLDCYGDAAPVWMVNAQALRVQVTPPVTSSRGDVALMHRTDGTGALDGVPIPTDAVAPSNVFKTGIVSCIETKQVWELIGLTKTGTTWSAEWGGRIDNVPTSSGAFPANTGYTGSGLSFLASSIKVSEAKAAVAGDTKAIAHALGLNLNYDSMSTAFCWPATRSDGTSYDAGAPQMGQRLRLKAGADLSGCTPLGKAVGEALKRYGAVVLGGAANIGFTCESGSVEQAKTGVDPWGAILGGRTVDTVLSGIPLDQLEAVSPGWGGPAWKPEATTPTTTTPTTPPTTTTPTSGSAAMRILGPTRSGLPWHSGCKADGPYRTDMVEKFGAWRGRPMDGGITYPEYDDKHTMDDLKNSGWCASLYNGFPGRIYYGFAPFASNPYYADKNPDGRLWARLANGEWDDVIDAQGHFLADQGRGNSVIRVAWEWNGDWYSWHAGLAGVNNFKNGFRRIVTRMRAISKNFVFVFEVNAGNVLVGSSGLTALTLAYPGDDVVDIVGIDNYQFAGEGAPDGNFSRYLRSGGSRGPMLDDVADFARQHGKGLGVFEWGIHGTNGYGDRPDFIEGMWNWCIANKDVLVAESYFNEAGSYIKCSLYNSETGAIQNPLSAAKYKALWSKGV